MVVGGERLAALVVEVGVGDMPLAVVVGVVARGPEPVSERGDFAGAEPPHAGVIGALGESVGLRDAVHVGILSRQEGGPTRDAGERAGVVALEADGVLGEPALAAQVLGPPSSKGGCLVGGAAQRDRPEVLDHDDRGHRPVGDGVGDVPDLFVGSEVTHL